MAGHARRSPTVAEPSPGTHAEEGRRSPIADAPGAFAPSSIAVHEQAIVVTWVRKLRRRSRADRPSCRGHGNDGSSKRAPGSHSSRRSFRGRDREAAALVDATIEDAVAGGEGLAVQYARWASAVLLNGLGRYDEALIAARLTSDDTPELFLAAWVLPELIEAASRTGNHDLASDALERLTEAAHAADADWALGIEARSRALLSADSVADELYREAIDRLGRTRLRSELARAHLLYGEWLRREGRRVDAREQLRTAHDTFAMIGMEAFAERAHRELLATGERVRTRSVETLEQLTPQEEQISRLARDGLSNQEIGAQLFLSPRTVEWHLRKVFVKLGVSSRRELRTALPHETRTPLSA
jgi:DNA-binding CsgD family transcriptional regulator